MSAGAAGPAAAVEPFGGTRFCVLSTRFLGVSYSLITAGGARSTLRFHLAKIWS